MTQPKHISSVSPPEGLVSLESKQKPVCEKSGIEFDSFYVYTRAKLDTSSFKSHLQSLPLEIWEDKNQEGNVNLIRPAHDKWGIKKIIFTFCDDFLQKIFDLPWSQKEEWRQFLLPIYASVGISKKQVVRSLLASMPPGVSIPVHHDTGYWVKRTHRLHVPIITSDQVDFLVGPTPELLKKVSDISLHIFHFYMLLCFILLFIVFIVSAKRGTCC